MSYDIETGLAVLVDGTDALFVDVSLALESISNQWATDRLSMVMVIGHLEHSEVSGNVYPLLVVILLSEGSTSWSSSIAPS